MSNDSLDTLTCYSCLAGHRHRAKVLLCFLAGEVTHLRSFNKFTSHFLNARQGLHPQFHIHHGNGAAKVQNPVLQSKVEPEVEVERSRVLSLLSLDGAVPGKEQDETGQLFFCENIPPK